MLDSHQHFWKVERGDYGWLTPDISSLYRDFMPESLIRELKRAGITRTILVQAAETEAETDFLLDIADKTDFVAGVVGWIDMEADNFSERLTRYRQHPKFVGIRPMLQGLPNDDYILRPKVLESLNTIADSEVPFDILTFPRHLPHVIAALRRVPKLKAVVDHMSKPDIAQGSLDPWRAYIEEIATFQNVFCKVSGMVTEAKPDWKLDDYRAHVDHVVRCFGPNRLMFGSDWPVCTLAASYSEVANLARTLLSSHFGPEELHRVFKENALRFYGV